jgi:anti-sigma-K factor RskA
MIEASRLNESHVFELLPAYALDALDEAETQLVSRHLIHCEACQIELAALQEVVEQLALPVATMSPPANLKDQLLERVQPAPRAQPLVRQLFHPRPRHPRLHPVWGVVALLLIVALALTSLFFWQQANEPPILVEPHGMRAIALSNTDAAPQASGFVVIGADGRNGALVVDKLPPLSPDQAYQLWLIRNEQHTSGAVFTVDESGYGGVRILAPDSLLGYSAVRITIEPTEGSAIPTGEPLMEGSLQNL